MTPAAEYVATFRTEEEALSAIRSKDVPPEAHAVIACDVSELPKTRRLRNRWFQVGRTPPREPPR